MNKGIENRFIRSFMNRARWQRAELEAASPSKRRDFLWRMHWDILSEYKQIIRGVSCADDILKSLKPYGKKEDAYIMALHSELDGRTMPVEAAVRQVYDEGLIATVYLPESDTAFAYDEFHDCWVICKRQAT